MSWFVKTLSGTIGRKIIMALSGLFLVFFLVEHLLSNLLLLSSDPAPFEGYVQFMKTNVFIKAAEYILFAGFLVHMIFAGIITWQNQKARPKGYHYSKPDANSSWASRNMGITGSVILAFLIVHLNSFFVPHKITGNPEFESLYEDASHKFSNGLYTGFYLIAMLILGFHLFHGVQSSFQTLGARHPKYRGFIEGFGKVFAIVVPLGFAMIPVLIYLREN